MGWTSKVNAFLAHNVINYLQVKAILIGQFVQNNYGMNNY